MSKTEFPFIVLTDTHDQSPKSMSAFTVHSVKDFLDFAQEEADWSYIVYNETKLEESFGSLEDCQDEVVNGYDCYGLEAWQVLYSSPSKRLVSICTEHHHEYYTYENAPNILDAAMDYMQSEEDCQYFSTDDTVEMFSATSLHHEWRAEKLINQQLDAIKVLYAPFN